MPGVIGVLTGKELKADGIGNLICGWMIHSKDGSPMKMGAWSPLAVDKVRYVGDAVVIVVAETKGQARDAAEAVEITYKELKAVVDATKALEKGAPQLHPEAENNLIFDWEIGDAKATDAAIKAAAHVTRMKIVNNRLVPNAMEPRAALGHYDKAEDHYTCWTTSQNPHVARLVMSAFYNIAPENKLRVIRPMSAAASVPRSTSIRKRSSACGLRRRPACPSNGSPTAPKVFCRTRMAATMSRRWRWPSIKTTG
ncbi:hypothetical protein AJ88_18925 [Mesorhizobium amorphae CCBAU 01583]|nr:hypothetical protein AJ88_18925 [Mesorhizobium amorphae CCBAU 01583]